MKMSDHIERKLYGDEFREMWGNGPWNDEPDEILWIDDDSGYKCVMRRNEFGAWCGYVAVPSSHPAHGLRSENAGDHLFCHWGTLPIRILAIHCQIRLTKKWSLTYGGLGLIVLTPMIWSQA
jgi:hypothetical protein